MNRKPSCSHWVAAIFLFLGMSPAAGAAGIELREIASGLEQPVFFTQTGDSTGRSFVVEQPGRVLMLRPGTSPLVFLDIRGRVLSGGEQGLLGLAFHPLFALNGRLFVNYTRRPDGATVIAEYGLSAGNPQAADAGSETVLLTIDQPFANHNGGMLAFGPDNLLYAGIGDGGSGNDPRNLAQNVTELLGKILRIDIDRPQSQTVRYSSPAANPFSGPAAGRDEIFAWGFRNPWRFSFDRMTGQLYAGDVGQGAVEEVDIVSNGGNYGWRVLEGSRCTNLGPASCAAPGFVPPIAEYANGQGGRCSITGGYVYRGSRGTLPVGTYVFGDFCSGEIFAWKDGVQSLLLDTTLGISSFGQDDAGELYVVALNGSIYRIENPAAVPLSRRSFSVPLAGAVSAASADRGLPLTVGYGTIVPDSGSTPPAGMAILGFRLRGILVSETAVRASAPLQSGRFLALRQEAGPEAGGVLVNTGVSIANPNASSAQVDFYFTGADGLNVRSGSLTIPPGGHVSAFIDESPFNGGTRIDGTFTFSSSPSAPVAVAAILGVLNERSEFLMTSLPVVPLPGSPGGTTFSHWVLGGGWESEFTLVNPTDQPLSGTLEFIENGAPAAVAVGSQQASSVSYSIPARSSRRFQAADAAPGVRTGWARIAPSGTPAPWGFVLYRLRTPVLVTQSGSSAGPGDVSFRTYGELSAAARSGLAFANPGGVSVTLTVDVFTLDGVSRLQSGSIALPAGDHRSMFLDEIPGLEMLAQPFQGVVRVTSTGPVGVSAQRSRRTERGEFLTAETPVFDGLHPESGRLVFPQLVSGGEYDMQIVLIHSDPGAGQSGLIEFVNGAGGAWSLFLP